MRKVYMVLSARSLSYAHHCLETLLQNSDEPLRLRLITDGPEDAVELRAEIERLAPKRHEVSVHAQAEIDAIAESKLAKYPNVRRFRMGHPCWRKITDPPLFAEDGEEMVLLDPDLYFPNKFRFEPTPKQGLLLMWQKPNCLLPPESVRAAISAGYKLAHHVDIGVANVPAPLDWDWLERFVGALGAAAIPRFMHIEAIVWSAMAMQFGGGHLDPGAWRCWQRTQVKRVLGKLKVPGEHLLRLEPFESVKCFHAGGPAKNWIPAARAAGILRGGGRDLLEPTTNVPYVELSPRVYETEQMAKDVLRRLGYYRLFGSS
jgi:hypothetical protein